MKEFTLSSLAHLVGGEIVGSTDALLTGVASLSEAVSGDVSFLGNEKYRDQVPGSRATVVLVPPDYAVVPPERRAWIVCKDPSAAFSLVVAEFTPPPMSFAAGIHPRAVIGDGCVVPASVHIGACSVIGAGAVIGENTVIRPGAFVGEEAVIGSDCFIHPNVTIRERCRLGNRVSIHSGTTIGSDGFGYISGPNGHEKVPQVGIVQIDDDVEIGANVTIDRARFGRTWIQAGSKIDNLVQIAHNVVIGRHCIVVAQVGISGSSRIGDGVILAGQAGVAGHLTIGPHAIVMGKAGVTKDVPPGAQVIGFPAVDRKRFAKMQVSLGRVEHMQASLKEMQREIAALRTRLDDIQ